MRRTGSATLPLHGGKAPAWLMGSMKRLAREVVLFIVEREGSAGVLRRLADPHWFQCLGAALGFDWHSSGVTTTTMAAVKLGLADVWREVGLWVAGGKGAAARMAPREIEIAAEVWGVDAGPLIRASRLAAKVDNAAVQDGHQLYHHAFVLTREGRWAVVQQGMDAQRRTARRYHWLSEGLASFVSDPHAAVASQDRREVLNLVAGEAAEHRAAVSAVAGLPPERNLKALERAMELTLPRHHDVRLQGVHPDRLRKVLLATYEYPPEDFESLLERPCLGPAALRALSLLAELVFGTPASFRDPAVFSFAHGGKDGHPYPADRRLYAQSIEILREAVSSARIGRFEKAEALRRLSLL